MKNLTIAVVGKDVGVANAYSSVEKALRQAAIFKQLNIHIEWIDSHRINENNVADILKGYNGILVPGGFNSDGVEGIILAINYARENKVPFFGICLGMQLTVIEFARNVAGLPLATSSEFDKASSCKVVDRLPGLLEGTLREGVFTCSLKADSLIEKCYQSSTIDETFRHGYSFNSDYKDLLQDKGLIISAFSKNEQYLEAVELNNHPFFLGVQFHPELSHLDKPHPLFISFIEAALNNK